MEPTYIPQVLNIGTWISPMWPEAGWPIFCGPKWIPAPAKPDAKEDTRERIWKNMKLNEMGRSKLEREKFLALREACGYILTYPWLGEPSAVLGSQRVGTLISASSVSHPCSDTQTELTHNIQHAKVYPEARKETDGKFPVKIFATWWIKPNCIDCSLVWFTMLQKFSLEIFHLFPFWLQDRLLCNSSSSCIQALNSKYCVNGTNAGWRTEITCSINPRAKTMVYTFCQTIILIWPKTNTVCWIRCYYPLLIQLPMNLHLKWSTWLLLVMSQFMLWRDVSGWDFKKPCHWLLTQILSISHQNHAEIMTGVITKATLHVQLVPQTSVWRWSLDEQMAAHFTGVPCCFQFVVMHLC